jgi:hypothetical protein
MKPALASWLAHSTGALDNSVRVSGGAVSSQPALRIIG